MLFPDIVDCCAIEDGVAPVFAWDDVVALPTILAIVVAIACDYFDIGRIQSPV
jgi:hypothetical protein